MAGQVIIKRTLDDNLELFSNGDGSGRVVLNSSWTSSEGSWWYTDKPRTWYAPWRRSLVTAVAIGMQRFQEKEEQQNQRCRDAAVAEYTIAKLEEESR